MKSSSRRYRRHRNPENAENKETPFFTPHQKAVQKKDDAFFQPKLSIGQPGDSYEREADAVASKVVNKQTATGTPVQKKEISTVQRMSSGNEEDVQMKGAPDKKEEEKKVQKKSDKKEEEKKVQKKSEGNEEEVQMKSAPDKKEEEKKVQKKSDKKEEEKPIQKKEEQEKKPAADEVLKEEQDVAGKHPLMAKENPGGLKSNTDGLSQQLKEQSGKGATLSPEVRNEMSNAIGADFSGVNIHTGDKAKELSNELGAQAFTHGNDVYFNSGKYDTESSTGKHLLAHELTHVVQQGAAPELSGSKKGTSAPSVQRDISTPLPEGVKPDEESKVAKFPIGSFSVEIKPDRKAVEGEIVKPNGAITKGDIAYLIYPSYTNSNPKKVKSASIKKTLMIETVYSASVTAQSSSGYGRGALKQDKKDGHGTLGFHEGSHGTDLMEYVQTHAFPEIVIKSPVTQEKFATLVEAWKLELKAYVADMLKNTEEKTDNVKDPVEEKK
ncbi:protein of unknown function [Chitinophaga sp. CF118]|uniref:eCIS core domain-containing protein n=1 Tax=Chitinophaga sp. CF118 TaxID=1884367 RepID=UPI0008DEF581|nr:DUF4157 domain-containing protein [Chitinophaga sp. CF118]SFD74061.1 protein of unknown function [Chitinophaga sp. CF118]